MPKSFDVVYVNVSTSKLFKSKFSLSQHVKPNSILFLKTKTKDLQKAVDFMESEGFQYKQIAFVKPLSSSSSSNTYTKPTSDFVLVGKTKIGTLRDVRGGGARNVRQLVKSEKDILAKIDQMFPSGRKLFVGTRRRR